MIRAKSEPHEARMERLSLERLRCLLDAKETARLWTASKAAWYLVGIDIDNTFWSQDLDRERHGYKWLPGAEARFATCPDVRDQDIDDLHEYVAAICVGESRRPTEWICYAISKGLEPVWLRIACADVRCRKHLPQDLLKRFGGLAPGEKPQSRGGKAKSALDEKSEAMRELRAPFEDWWKVCPKKVTGRPAHGQISRFAEEMALSLNDLVEKESIENRVREWIKEKLREKPTVLQTHRASAGF